MEQCGKNKRFTAIKINLQGDPNQKLQLQMAVTVKVCISDPMLVKPKLV